MDPSQRGANPRETALEPAIQKRLASIESGNTRRATRTALETFAAFLREERGVDDLADLTVTDCRRFAQHLRARTTLPEDDGARISAATATQYYARVRATCTWWVQDERLAVNPAKPNRATGELPEDTETPTRQTWSDRQRAVLLGTADRRADEANEAVATGGAPESDRLLAHRNRALAFALAWAGVRGGEVLRDPQDAQRTGVTWRDVTDEGTLRLLGKTRERERAPLREPVRTRLDRWRTVLDPPTDDWPIFPTLDKGSLRRAYADRFGTDPGYPSDADVRTRLAAFADRGVAPPAASTNTGRRVMRRLTEAAGLDVEGGYLKPHGGRRGLGNTLWDEVDPSAAQDALRHKSPETTQEAYREKQQAELAARMDERFD